MIISICGKSGSGKSTLARKLMDYYRDAIHLEIDKIGHKALTDEKVKVKLINAFGNNILTYGKIDRKKLSKIVFDSQLEMDKLTDITWKYMQFEINKVLNNNKDKVIILDWALLSKTEYFDKCDLKVLLDVSYEIRKERAIKRDNITKNDFDLREKASIIYDKKRFDFVICDINKDVIDRLVNYI